MKQKTIRRAVPVLIILMLASAPGFAQIRGNGNIVKQERSVGDFTGVSVASGIDLSIEQGNQPALTVEADENLQEYIISEVREGVLHVYIKKGTRIMKFTRTRAWVTVAELKTLNVSGGGDVKSLSRITAGELSIKVSGGGDLDFELTADRVSCNLSGGGDAALNADIQEFKASLSGGGDLAFDGNLNMFDLNMSGGGDAVISGDQAASGIMVNMSGGGDLSMIMPCDRIKINVSGGGDVNIASNGKVSKAAVDITGGGDLVMKMNTEDCMINVGGGGDAMLQGSAERFAAEIKSGGDLDAEGFTTQITKLELTGGANARIRVEQALSVNASGGSQIYVSGDPRVDANLTGGSKVHTR